MAKRKAKFVELWERQPGEQARQFKAFCHYRDMIPGDQTIKRIAALTGVAERTLADWKRDFKWEERSQAWTDYQDQQAREKYLKEIDEMRENHIRVSRKVMDKVEEYIDSMTIEDMKTSDVARLIEVAAKLERLSRGDTGEAVEVRDGGKAVNPVTFVMPSNGRDEDREDEGE